MRNNNTVNIKTARSWFILILAYCVLLYPFICTVFCSVPAADDFCKWKVYDGITSLFVQSLERANGAWLSWSGGWLYMLLQELLSPVIFTNMLSVVSCEMLVLFLLFVLEFIFFSYTLFRELLRVENKRYCFFLAFFLLALLLCGNVYTEIFYWFVGSSYAWGAGFCMLSMAFMIKLESNGNKPIVYALALLFGLFACNANNYIVTAGLACLLLNISYYSANRKINRAYAVMMLLFVIVGVLTVFAPGNFARHQAIDGDAGFNFLMAFENTVVFIRLATLEMLKRASILLLFSGLFIFSAFMLHKNVNIRVNPFMVLAFLIVSLVGAIYPVAMGYSGTEYFPNRIKFIICINEVVGLGLLAVWAGWSFGKWLRLDEMKTSQAFAVPAVMLAVMAVVGMKYEIRSTEPYWQTFSGLEAVKAESWDYKCLLNEIKDSPDADVVIEHPYHEPTGILMPPGLEEDTEFWINKPVAHIFHKNSVSVVTTFFEE